MMKRQDAYDNVLSACHLEVSFQNRRVLFSHTTSANSSYETPLIFATTCAMTRTCPSAPVAIATYLCRFIAAFDSHSLFPLLSF